MRGDVFNQAPSSPGQGYRRDDKHIDWEFADQIHALRRKRGLTQVELGVRLGVSTRTVEKVETGNVTVRRDVYERFNDWRILA